MSAIVGRVAVAAGVATLVMVTSAHVGSPNAFFTGKAGPYDVSVVVRPPTVVPGLAEVTVRIPAAQAAGVARVVVRPVFWRTGTAGSPKGDEAVRVAAPEPTFAGKLWLMSPGSYSVNVTVEGASGAGTAVVPVAAFPTARLALGTGLRVTLVALGLFLVAGLLTIVHAAAGESLVAPGSAADDRRRRAARRATAVALPVLAVALLGGWRWWQAEAAAFERTLYRPLAVQTVVEQQGGAPALTMRVLDSAWLAGNITPVIPDHGKMMHMFLVRDPHGDAFAHLHPVMKDSATFVTPLPALPPGRYRVYGDVVHESGFERTLLDTVQITGQVAAGAVGDPDDSWMTPEQAALGGTPGGTATLAGGSRMQWVGDTAVAAKREVVLRFRVSDAGGRPVDLEPYMGMPAHAVVTRTDGAVFVHLHPMGSVTMAAQEAFVRRDRGDTTPQGRLRRDGAATQVAPSHAHGAGSEVSFPYEFPESGDYRVFVQVKHGGAVRTAVFAVTVR